jgi:hypothetical protein
MVCVCVHLCVCVNLTYMCVYTWICTYIYIYIYILCIHTHPCIHVYIRIYMVSADLFICKSLPIYTHIYMYRYVHTWFLNMYSDVNFTPAQTHSDMYAHVNVNCTYTYTLRQLGSILQPRAYVSTCMYIYIHTHATRFDVPQQSKT